MLFFTRVNKLTDNKFQETFLPPMRFIEEDEESSGINLKKYVQKIIKNENLNTTIDDIEIHYVYHTSDEKYEHILFYFGISELYMVVVNNLETRKIMGYHMLDLIEKYGLGEIGSKNN